MRQSRTALIAALSVQRTSTMQAMAGNKNDVDVSSPTGSTCSFSSSCSSFSSSSSTSSRRSDSPPPLLFVTSPEQKVSKIVPPSPSMFANIDDSQLKFRLSDAVLVQQKQLSLAASSRKPMNYTTQVLSPRPVSSSHLSTPRYLPTPNMNMMYYAFEASSKVTSSAKVNAYTATPSAASATVSANKPTGKKAVAMAATSWRRQEATKPVVANKENKKESQMAANWRRHQPCPNDIYFVATPASPLSPLSPKQLAFAVKQQQSTAPVATAAPRSASKDRLQALTQSALKRNSKRTL